MGIAARTRQIGRNRKQPETQMLNRRQALVMLSAAPAALALAGPARAAEPEIYAPGGVAINGYDPVAYFTANAPTKGSDSFALMWMGATWLFASAENRSTFEMNPGKYAPAYGGYCAYAVSRGYTASTEPSAWTVYEDRLYLNFSLSVRALWAVRRAHHIEQAEANWPGVLG